ncbi:extracellular solute-binding protein [Anaerocolumna sedimenticola]|uniref:Extracellular solute-binding protein n=1 Tax=Anaerocolumna sedimenticola TaxID=2696063 RepID=A0A6P1TL16_9FIRM|nr:extracellular solute-binding protein [Anaerocolumna sedimenticola]QHQ61910.1 extracellular solute-binding protein [Anaerocolumna sedimenticola]
MKKKMIAILLSMTVILLMFTGCGSKPSLSPTGGKGDASSDNASTEVTKQAESKGEVTQLTFWTYVEQHADFFQDAAKTWNENHPEEQIELKTETYPLEDMHSKLLITLQSGDGAPDIVDVNVAKFSDFMQGGEKVFVPLNDVIEPEKSNFLEPVLDIYKYDNNYYGIEYHVGAPMMYYNTEILDQAGVKVEDIVTWNDLHEAGKKVLAATGKPIITFEVADSWSYYIMTGEMGGDYFDEKGNCIIDSEANAKTLDFMMSMLEDGTAVTTPGGGFHTEEYYGFMSKGGAASMLECMWYMGRFTDYMPELSGKIQMAAPPVWDDSSVYPVFGGTATSVTTQCKNQDLATRFLADAKISAEGAGKIWNVLGFDPLRWDIWETDVMKQDNKFTDYFGKDIFNIVINMKDKFHTSNITASPKFSLANSLVSGDILFKVLSEKSETPADALKSAADEINNSK